MAIVATAVCYAHCNDLVVFARITASNSYRGGNAFTPGTSESQRVETLRIDQNVISKC